MNNSDDFNQLGMGCVFVGIIVLIGAMIASIPATGGDPMAFLIWICLIVGLVRMVLAWSGFDN